MGRRAARGSCEEAQIAAASTEVAAQARQQGVSAAEDSCGRAVVASTLFVLRRRQGDTGGYSMPGYPWLPALYIVCLLGVAARDFSEEPLLSLAGIAILLTGWPLFKLGHRLFGGRADLN